MAIDFDNFRERQAKLEECLSVLPKPFFIRLSASKEGLHINLTVPDMTYRELYDDPIRLRIDQIREKNGLTSDILSNKKFIDGEMKAAGRWRKIKDTKDFKEFLKEILT